MRLRPGDSAADRLARARALARVAPSDPESALTVARAALEAQDLAAARKTLAPLLQGEGVRPTARVCLLMAEIEEAAGDDGAVREWLARAARAPRDRAWVAGEIIADRWAPGGAERRARRLRLAHARRAHRRAAAAHRPCTPPAARRAAGPAAAPAVACADAARARRRRAPPAASPRLAALLLANAPDDPGPHTSRKSTNFGNSRWNRRNGARRYFCLVEIDAYARRTKKELARREQTVYIVAQRGRRGVMIA